MKNIISYATQLIVAVLCVITPFIALAHCSGWIPFNGAGYLRMVVFVVFASLVLAVLREADK